MLTFEINNQTEFPLRQSLVKEVAMTFSKVFGLNKKKSFSLALVDDRTMKVLNCSYRKKNKVTDVLSFMENQDDFVDVSGNNNYIGEIVICPEQAKRQSVLFGCSVKQEMSRLLVHGLAHLFGYDHENVSKKEAAKMIDLEKKVMAKIKFI